MERDWEVIRNTLLRLSGPDVPVAEVPPALIQLLTEAGLAREDFDWNTNTPVLRLTWDGHELADTVRNEEVWNHIVSAVRKAGVGLSFEAVNIAASAVVKSLF